MEITEEKTVSVAPEELFLHRFLHSGGISSNGNCNGSLSIERALEQRQASTLDLLENLLQAIDTENTKNAQLFSAIGTEMSSEGDFLHLNGFWPSWYMRCFGGLLR